MVIKKNHHHFRNIKAEGKAGKESKDWGARFNFFVAYAIAIPAIYMTTHHSKAPQINKKNATE